MKTVLLITMPFGPLLRPSIGLGLLQASLKLPGVKVKTLFLTFKFAEKIGTELYNQISAGYPDTTTLLGEWIFARYLFRSEIPDAESYIENVLRSDPNVYRKLEHAVGTPAASDSFLQQLRDVCDQVEPFFNECINEIKTYDPVIVGFTSSFQQHLASLSLAKLVKAELPNAFVLFGGANCEGVMGVESVKQFPFIDALVSGEGEHVFPVIVECVLAGKSICGLQGVYTSGMSTSGIANDFPNALSVQDLDSLPFPDYTDFFEQLEDSNLKTESPRLLFETSRGCWWGQKKHCTFCGLNGSAMGYRSKSAARALDELYYLTSLYPKCPVEVVDNILDMKYFDDFIPQLAADHKDLEIFYEVKANLKKTQVRQLSDAGIREIQPGIESLSSEVLALMRKGVSGIQNVQVLKWCKEFGIRPYWNLIWGFPGESPEEYRRMAEMVSSLTHLPPPEFIGPLRLDRFSPNFNFADDLGFVDVKPYPAYSYVYPFPQATLENLAYYFTFKYRNQQDSSRYVESLKEQVDHWQQAYENSDLFSKDFGSYLIIFDLRPRATERLKLLSGNQRSIYTLCDQICSLEQLSIQLEKLTGLRLPVSEVNELLQPLVDEGLMIREGNRVLSLAIPVGEYLPRRHLLETAFAVANPADPVIAN